MYKSLRDYNGKSQEYYNNPMTSTCVWETNAPFRLLNQSAAGMHTSIGRPGCQGNYMGASTHSC